MNYEDSNDAKEAFETAFKTIVTEQPVSVLPVDSKVVMGRVAKRRVRVLNFFSGSGYLKKSSGLTQRV